MRNNSMHPVNANLQVVGFQIVGIQGAPGPILVHPTPEVFALHNAHLEKACSCFGWCVLLLHA
jgi:hypothetical protein